MNTLQNLRDTLDRHAGDVPPDSAASARVASVQARAVRLRRQRTGAVTAAAAAVLGVVGVAALLPAGTLLPASQDRTLLGREAPAEMTSLGYTYAFAEGVESSDGAASIELEPSDEPRLITWAAEGAESVRVVSPGPQSQTSVDVGFGDWLVVPPGSEGTYTVRGDSTALGVYELTDERPAGVTVDGITYRDEVAGARLLDAEIGAVGEGEVAVTFKAPRERVQLSALCAGSAPGVWVHVVYDGERGGSSSGPACDESSFDPGSNGGWTSRVPGRAGDQVTVRVHLTDGENGPRVAPDDVRLGLGAYAVPEPVDVVVRGYGPSALLEHDGHRWAYQRSVSEFGSESLTFPYPGGDPVLVVGSFRGAGSSAVRFDDGQAGGTLMNTGSGGGVRAVLSTRGQGATLRVRGDATRATQLAFAIYERVD